MAWIRIPDVSTVKKHQVPDPQHCFKVRCRSGYTSVMKCAVFTTQKCAAKKIVREKRQTQQNEKPGAKKFKSECRKLAGKK
jgi:hypothetical protein